MSLCVLQSKVKIWWYLQGLQTVTYHKQKVIDHLSSSGFVRDIIVNVSKLLEFWKDVIVWEFVEESTENSSFKKPAGLSTISVYGGGWYTF